MQTSANFYCAECGALAALLTLNDANQLIQEGFWGVTTEGILPQMRPAVEAALAKADADKLYHMDSLWASFYCQTCKLVYCYQHWLIIPEFDEDFPGWYDCSYGTCPQGHRRLIDD